MSRHAAPPPRDGQSLIYLCITARSRRRGGGVCCRGSKRIVTRDGVLAVGLDGAPLNEGGADLDQKRAGFKERRQTGEGGGALGLILGGGAHILTTVLCDPAGQYLDHVLVWYWPCIGAANSYQQSMISRLAAGDCWERERKEREQTGPDRIGKRTTEREEEKKKEKATGAGHVESGKNSIPVWKAHVCADGQDTKRALQGGSACA